MRLIDAHLAQKIADREIGGETASLIQYVLSHTPTIEAEPVRHGRWYWKPIDERTSECTCSVCGQGGCDDFNYCPNCGAKMRGDSNEP